MNAASEKESEMTLAPGLKRFLGALRKESFDTNVSNFYRSKGKNAQVKNLQRYLAHMHTLGTQTLLVGEAPGYNGCRLTGIPFTSEQIVFQGVRSKTLFGVGKGYLSTAKRVKKEQSAAAMWSVLEDADTLPLLWNAFPFHPYKEGNENSNRKPTAKELERGKPYLLKLIELFDIKTVIAVGNTADEVLRKMQIEHLKVRHPSYGGKAAFTEQLCYNLKKEKR